MERGYVKVWRKTLDTGILTNPTVLQVFMYLLLKASHKKHKVLVGNQSVDVLPGDVITGRSKMAQDLDLSERNVRTALNTLEKLEIVTIRPTNKFSIVSFINWYTYQQDSQTERPTECPASDQQVTSKRPASDHKQECKNIKEDTNVSLSFPPEKDEQAEESVPRETVPVQRILDLYREELPFLRQPRMIRPNVAASIKARWHEKKKEGKFADEEGGLAYFRHVFRYVSQNAFLSGRKTNWKADFEWIVKAANWDKITTGKYAEDDGK